MSNPTTPRQLFLILLLISLAVHAFWLVAEWPGLLNYDAFVNLLYARAGALNFWTSNTYSFYLILLQRITHEPWLIGVVQSVVSSLLAALFFTWVFTRLKNKYLTFCLFIFYILMPLNPLNAIFYTRGWMFSWSLISLTVFFAFVSIQYIYFKKNPNIWHWILFALLSFLTSDLRHDGIVCVLLFFIFAIILFRKNKEILIHMSVCVLLPYALALYFDMIHARPIPSYQSTSMLNPLTDFIHQKIPISEKERAVISKVFKYENLEAYFDPLEIPAFHSGAFKRSATQQDFREFEKVYLSLVFRNPIPFFKNRLNMAKALFGLGSTYYFSDEIDYPNPMIKDFKTKLNITASQKIMPLWSKASAYFRSLITRPMPPWYLASLVPSFLISFAILFSYKILPVSAMSSGLVLARIPFVLLAAPAPQFHYVYSLYLFTFALIPLVLVELKLKGIKLKIFR